MMTNPCKVSPDLAQSSIMIVDDNSSNLMILERVLNLINLKNIRSFSRSRVALDSFLCAPPDLLILDLAMPELDGYAFLEAIGESRPQDKLLPVLVYTADLGAEAKIRALGMGATDFLTKPGDAVEIQLRVHNFLSMARLHRDLQWYASHLEDRVLERTADLELSRREAVMLLSRAAEYRDDETGQHTMRVGDLSARLAEKLGLDINFGASLRMVAPLHDVGKIGIPDYILRKPTTLTEDEYALMKTHAIIGGDLLAETQSPLLQLAKEIARHHHERWDGKGYPSGLAGEDIPISARIVAVADAYDAITNDRPYRKARTQHEALVEIRHQSGHQFDPTVVDALLSLCAEQRAPMRLSA